MSQRLISVFVSILVALSLSLGPAATVTTVAHADVLSDKKGGKKKSASKTKVKVTTQKGKAKGRWSFLLGRSSNGDTNNQFTVTGSLAGKHRDTKISATLATTMAVLCYINAHDPTCFEAGLAKSHTLTAALARAMALSLVTQVDLPVPKPVFGPDPKVNEWKMLAVGFPIWLWTEGPTTVSSTTSAGGFTFTMTARWKSTSFDMGDGGSASCTAFTTYTSAARAGSSSPTCGYVYQKPSLPKGAYTVTATSDWDVTWSVAGFSGVVPAYNTGSSTIPIGELQALNR